MSGATERKKHCRRRFSQEVSVNHGSNISKLEAYTDEISWGCYPSVIFIIIIIIVVDFI